MGWREFARLAAALVIFASMASGKAAPASPSQSAKNAWPEDFSSGLPAGWSKSSVFKPGYDGDRRVLIAGGPTQEEREKTRLALVTANRILGDGAVECRIKTFAGNWAGIVFRRSPAGWFEVFLDGGRQIVVRRHPGAVVLSSVALPASRDSYRRLRVVGLGPVVRAYVDGVKLVQFADEERLSGQYGLVVHQAHVAFDQFMATSTLAPAESILLRPRRPMEPLLVAPGAAAQLELELLSAFAQGTPLGIEWHLEGADKASKEGHIPCQIGAEGRATAASLSVGPLAEGLHWIDLRVMQGKQTLEQVRWPVAAIRLTTGRPEEPFFPIGVYDKYAGGGEPFVRHTILHAFCADLRQHGVNTLLSGGAISAPPRIEELDIVARYGMKTVLRANQNIPPELAQHSAVLAFMYGDEPTVKEAPRYREKYDALAKQFPKMPVASCLVGEGVGTQVENDPWLVLPILKPELCMIRYYPMRKSCYDLVRYASYKGWMSPSDVFRMLEVAAGGRPWWYVAQTFGGNVTAEAPEPYWRNPTGNELRGMLHLALAHGARGIFCYTYQVENPRWMALVDAKTLQPADDKYEALAAVARQIAPARQVLLQAEWSGLEVRTSIGTVDAVGRQTADGRRFVYLVNRDTRQNVAGTMLVMPIREKNGKELRLVKAIELFSGLKTDAQSQGGGAAIKVQLGPGDGQLWELADFQRP